MKAKLVNEKLGLGKIGRKLDWGLSADTRSPKEFASEIKELPDETLLKWYDDFVPYNPSSQAKFQQRLVKLELEKRGLIKETLNEKLPASDYDNDYDGRGVGSYSDDQIKEIGIQYQGFLDYIHRLNYDDLIEYAEKRGHFKTLSVLEYLKKKSKYI